MAYCVNCGNVARVDGNFCEGCGSPLHPTGYVPTYNAVHAVVQCAPSAGQAAQAERTGGNNLVRIAAIIVLVGFFLPWVSCPGMTGPTTASGIELASHGAGGLWVVPISMAIALIVLLNGGKTATERSTGATVAILSGLASVIVLIYYWAQFNGVGQRDDFGLNAVARQAYSIEVGAALSFFGSIVVMIGGLVQRVSASNAARRNSAAQGVSPWAPG
jgi:hypothetical protein